MSRPESEFPTISQLRDCLTQLVDRGLGAQPVQILLVPDSTLQATARATGGPGYNPANPALMIELEVTDGSRLPVTIMSAERMSGRGVPLPTQ